MTDFVYPLDLEISYTNNAEYREFVRKLFKMSPTNYNPTSQMDGLDPESKDELEYDDAATSKGLDWIYNQIKDNELFQYILAKAAAKYLSEDPGIGLSVMMCYEYLDVFHACIKSFLTTPEEFNETNMAYLNLLVKL